MAAGVTLAGLLASAAPAAAQLDGPRPVGVPEIRATRQEIRGRSDFLLDLKDCEIGGLRKLRMQEEIEVHVDVTLSPK